MSTSPEYYANDPVPALADAPEMRMKAAVFFSAGLGDAILLVPLVKELKRQGTRVTGIFTSKFHCEKIFTGTAVFDEIIVLADNNSAIITISAKYFKKFDVTCLNNFAYTRKNLLLATAISKKIITNRLNPVKHELKAGKIQFTECWKGIHDAAQNLRLLSSGMKIKLEEDMFRIDFPDENINGNWPTAEYVTVQVSSGNNIQQYKNWPVNHWIKFLRLVTGFFPGKQFLLLGEPREILLAEKIMNEKIPGVSSAVGKTSIPEVIQLLRRSELFIGLDGGLMHLAVACGKPTFTLWGASDFTLYGYQEINAKRHRVIYREISCRPCNSWIEPNTSRVKNPEACPDYICMQNLDPDFVFSQFRDYYSHLG